MIDERPPYTAADLARRLGISRNRFYKVRRELEARRGMPAPLPGAGWPRWSRAAIDAWLDPGNAVGPDGLTTAELEEGRAELARAYRRPVN